jgi:hypothetical protein
MHRTWKALHETKYIALTYFFNTGNAPDNLNWIHDLTYMINGGNPDYFPFFMSSSNPLMNPKVKLEKIKIFSLILEAFLKVETNQAIKNFQMETFHFSSCIQFLIVSLKNC